MSFDLRQFILDFAADRRVFTTTEILEALPRKSSRPTMLKTISALIAEGLLVRTGKRRAARYALTSHADALDAVYRRRLKNKNLAEHTFLIEAKEQLPFFRNLPENVSSTFDYTFSEMLNNAIEHSQSKYIELEVQQEDDALVFTVRDFGIGVFRNVMSKRGLASPVEAIQDLLKGKTTTAPQAHTGEGIFFTSKGCDEFVLDSFDYRLRIDNTIPDIFIEELHPVTRGTQVRWRLRIDSDVHLKDVFEEYQTDPSTYAFDTTEIQVKLYTMGTVHVSRSQARRVLDGLEKFEKIIFDFEDVPTVGQAFADEIFRVFQQRHPDKIIEAEHMNEAVRFMVERARNAAARD